MAENSGWVKDMVRTILQGNRDENRLSEKALKLLAAHDREVESAKSKDTTLLNA